MKRLHGPLEDTASAKCLIGSDFLRDSKMQYAEILTNKTGLQRSKRYGKVYKSDDVPSSLTNQDVYPAKRVSVCRSSYSSMDFKAESSTTSSMVFPSDESSLDFGNDYSETCSGEFDDFFLRDIGREKPPMSWSVDSNYRFSSSSFGSSFATNRNTSAADFLIEDFDTDTTDAKDQPQLSSSDESDAQGHISKSRISAATLYEDAVSSVLESSRRGLLLSRDSTDSSIMESSSDVSVPLRGALFNTYAKDKLDGINTVPASDMSSGTKNEQDKIPHNTKDTSSVPNGSKQTFPPKPAYVSSPAIETTKGARSPLGIKKLNSDVLSGVPIRIRLERQQSMDSSVSTISEADTVIFNPYATDLSRNNSSAGGSRRLADVNLMPRSVSAEGIMQKPNDNGYEAKVSSLTKPRPKPACKLPPCETFYQPSSIRKASPAKLLQFKKSYDNNPSSDSMEEQELTMDLSDSQVSEKEDTPPQSDNSRRRRSHLGQLTDSAPIDVEVKPYEDRKRPSIKDSSSNLESRTPPLANTSSEDSADDHTQQNSTELSSSMEVLHSSSELLDEKNRSNLPWVPKASFISPESLSQLNRSSIGSFGTDLSESFISAFSETEDENVPNETSDEDLLFEEEQIRQWIEVRIVGTVSSIHLPWRDKRMAISLSLTLHQRKRIWSR